MKRFHVHVAVNDLEQSIRFYSALFGAAPAVTKPDYAKWMLDDPRINFAISNRSSKTGVNHLGLQADNSAELDEIGARLAQADVATSAQKGASCCYAKSDKYWTVDPQGVAWESFHTLDSIPVFGEDARAKPDNAPAKAAGSCCAPATQKAAEKATSCC
ncbi:MAG TPA: ArsI/CadI family heavy metal resistance metalloenzyme [Burkholderiales bacterium]|nr:ArsI/CadI family heavy metal resistance metalloenzyme [Burkholderiales bacterium]